jgi:hypothetical protein
VHIHVKNFSVINQARFANRTFRDTTLSTMSNTQCLTDLWSWQVGAVSLNATLNCEDFATAHSSTAHFDIKARLPLFFTFTSLVTSALRFAVVRRSRVASRGRDHLLRCASNRSNGAFTSPQSHQCCALCAEVYSTGRAKCAFFNHGARRTHTPTHAALARAVSPGASSSGSCTGRSRACYPSCCASARRRACSS